MAVAGASDEVSVPGLGSVSAGVVSVLVSVGLGSRNVAEDDGASLASVLSPMPVALTPRRTASPPSRPMATATPTRATRPVSTGRFSVSMAVGKDLSRGGGDDAIVGDERLRDQSPARRTGPHRASDRME